MSSITLVEKIYCKPGQPLWQRVPTQDEQGKCLSDFMMLIPKLGRQPELRRAQVVQELLGVLAEYDEIVVFADLNLKLNLLWVSVRQNPTGCITLAAAIKERIPEAVLVANRAEALVGVSDASKRRRGKWGFRLLR